MLALFMLYYFLSANVAKSLPVPAANTSTQTNLSFGDVRIQNRTMWDIVWACLTTTFACTWISVHPNVPAPSDGWWTQFWRHTKAMFWAMIAPELVICWALRQWFGARKNTREINQFLNENNLVERYGRWSMKHGHFLQMGGFMIYKVGPKGDVPITTIRSYKELCALVRCQAIAFPDVTKKELEDRSKGDAISKSFTTLQTTWFVIQCITRGARHFAITKLEIVTLALAALNGIMCVLWWSKPLGVIVPVRVPCLIDIPTSPTSRISHYGASSVSDRIFRYIAMLVFDPVNDLLGALGNGSAENDPLPDVVVLSDKNDSVSEKDVVSSGSHQELSKDPDAVILATILGRRTNRVSDFHASEQLTDGQRVFVFFVGALFGGIHCTGWKAAFPTHTEATLWHISSIAIIVIPLFFIPIATRKTSKRWLAKLNPDDTSLWAYLTIGIIGSYMAFGAVCLFIYIVARLFLFTEAVVSLRDLPASAYFTVRWNQFLPHV